MKMFGYKLVKENYSEEWESEIRHLETKIQSFINSKPFTLAEISVMAKESFERKGIINRSKLIFGVKEWKHFKNILLDNNRLPVATFDGIQIMVDPNIIGWYLKIR